MSPMISSFDYFLRFDVILTNIDSPKYNIVVEMTCIFIAITITIKIKWICIVFRGYEYLKAMPIFIKFLYTYHNIIINIILDLDWNLPL